MSTPVRAHPARTGTSTRGHILHRITRAAFTAAAVSALTLDGAVAAVAAHIRGGDRRTAGSVVIPLSVGTGTSFEVSDCVTADPSLLAAIEEDPGD